MKRIENLEKESLFLKRLYVFLCFIFAAFLLVGAAPKTPSLVEAEKFILKDTNGIQRAVLQVTEKGGPGMYFHDTRGEVRLFVGLSCLKCDDFSGLAFFDQNGEVRVSLMTNIDGTSTLAFRDAKGMQHELLGVDVDGSPFLQLTDSKGNVIWKAP